MEISDIFLTLVGLIIAMLGWFMSRLADTVKKLDEKLSNYQIDMHDRFVQKSEFQADIAELRAF
jgi:outer membrane lipoprotein-sorting protein